MPDFARISTSFTERKNRQCDARREWKLAFDQVWSLEEIVALLN
jgi:hypothetical protein